MSETSTYHDNVIRALGGKAKLSDALGLSRDVLTKWHRRGIPSKYWYRVVEIGATSNPPVAISVAELDRTKPAPAEAAV
jgi:hypothetical protein